MLLRISMTQFEGEHSGAMLAGFVRCFASSPGLVAQILARHRFERIEPERWYPIESVRALYDDFRDQTGARVLFTAGLRLVEKTYDLLPGLEVRSVLPTLEDRYRELMRGPRVGGITCTIDEDHGAVMVFTTPFPCALCRGVVQGYCERAGTPSLIEHGAGGCTDSGDASCTYRVSW